MSEMHKPSVKIQTLNSAHYDQVVALWLLRLVFRYVVGRRQITDAFDDDELSLIFQTLGLPYELDDETVHESGESLFDFEDNGCYTREATARNAMRRCFELMETRDIDFSGTTLGINSVWLGDSFKLTPLQQELIELAVMGAGNSTLKPCIDKVIPRIQPRNVSKYLATILDTDAAAISQATSSSGKLARSGLLSVNPQGHCFSQVFLCHDRLAETLLAVHSNPDELLKCFV